MPLECGCYNYDFDKNDYDHWYEGGHRIKPSPGERCCECGSTVEDNAYTICEYETFIPDGYDEIKNKDMEKHEEFYNNNGYDWDLERFERLACVHYRCDRCQGLVEAIEGLGYCFILPGDLINCHTEYIEMGGGHKMKWVVDFDGVLHPVKFTKFDYLCDNVHKKYILMKFKIKFKVRNLKRKVREWLEKFGRQK